MSALLLTLPSITLITAIATLRCHYARFDTPSATPLMPFADATISLLHACRYGHFAITFRHAACQLLIRLRLLPLRHFATDFAFAITPCLIRQRLFAIFDAAFHFSPSCFIIAAFRLRRHYHAVFAIAAIRCLLIIFTPAPFHRLSLFDAADGYAVY